MGTDATRPPPDALPSERLMPEDCLRAIGCLTLEVAFVERTIDEIFVFHSDALFAELVTHNKTLKPKIDMLKILATARALNERHAAEAAGLLSEIDVDVKRRNTVIHGAWHAAPVNNWLEYFNQHRPSAEAYVQKGGAITKASEIMDLARAFNRHETRLRAWHARFEDKAAALP
jgi:hypothetical protein